MKANKFLPFIILGAGLLLVVVVFVIAKGQSKPATDDTTVEESAPEIPFDQRPVVTLAPKSDGHWLTMNMKNVNHVSGGSKLEYEIFYTAGDGRNQGFSGTVDLSNVVNVDNRDILLGSESSGKFRYDSGVEKGTLSIKWRDTKGKLVGKLTSEWHLQSASDTLTSVDGAFTYKLNSLPKKGFFLTMQTLGVPQGVNGSLVSGPYGVFTSETGKFPGTVTISGDTIWMWNEASWMKVNSAKATNLGVFVGTSSNE